MQVTRVSPGGTFLPQALLGAEGRRGVRAASVALEELKGFIQTQCLAWTPRQTMASKLLHIQLSLLQRDSSLSDSLHQMPTFSPPPHHPPALTLSSSSTPLSLDSVQTVNTRELVQPKCPFQRCLTPNQAQGSFVDRARVTVCLC